MIKTDGRLHIDLYEEHFKPVAGYLANHNEPMEDGLEKLLLCIWCHLTIQLSDSCIRSVLQILY
jgi:hypothetical protein